MKIIEPGHVYQLHHLDGSGAGLLVFVNREDGTEHEGTQTQEVLRALIDRTRHCDGCLRWEGNDKIIEHLRMALVLHEARALERKTQKGELQPETVQVDNDGHFKVRSVKYVPGVGVHHLKPERVQVGTLGVVDMAPLFAGPCQHGLRHEVDLCRHKLHMGTTCEQCLRECSLCWDACATASTYCPRPSVAQGYTVGVDMATVYDEPKTTDYCVTCGESPESGSHLPGHGHNYIDPRYNAVTPRRQFVSTPFMDTTVPYRCNVPMCGESGVCEECRKRGAR